MSAFPTWLRCIVFMLLSVLALAGCANDRITFVPPDQRPISNAEQPWPHNRYLVLGYHDVEDVDPDQTFGSVRSDHLVEQFSWLRDNGYQPVSIEQILAAGRGGPALPDKAVLLSFDDGHRSFYTRVLPILKAFNWPAVMAPVTSWVDVPGGQDIDFGGKLIERKHFLTWQQIAEIARSGLVEIGAHTDNLHFGITGNPQGNEQPAAATHRYDPATGSYETDEAFKRRISRDVELITSKIRQATGKPPRVWVWPYGAAQGQALQVVKEHGYEMAMTLGDGLAYVDDPMNVPRLLITNDPPLQLFARAVIGMEAPPQMRVAHVDLDYVYDDDPEQMERNLDAVVQRMANLKITTVFLQAFADPTGDGLAREVYFPNRHLPMRADLFNRAAWQLRSRAFVDVYAWMPVLSFDLAPELTRVERWYPENGHTAVSPEQYVRLSPFDPRARQQIIDIYEDLARYTSFSGVLFHDDAVLSDFEDASPPALAAYREAGLGDSIEALRSDPDTLQRWTRFKSRYLIDFTQTLADHVKAIRGPQTFTARNIYAAPILQPESETWFAQNLDDFLQTYDWTAPMAMPWMEQVPADQDEAWLKQLVDTVASRAGALERTVFELQARDWSTEVEGGEANHIESRQLAKWMQALQRFGARNFGYYPDDFAKDEPLLDVIRPSLSNDWYPF